MLLNSAHFKQRSWSFPNIATTAYEHYDLHNIQWVCLYERSKPGTLVDNLYFIELSETHSLILHYV